MALHIPYHRNTFRPALAGTQGDRPVEFDLAPAEGPDQARLKSILFGTAGLVGGAEQLDWSPATQDAVIGSLEKGRDAFVHTVEAVRHLTVPAALAKRVGLIAELPETVHDGVPAADPDAPIPIRTGAEFARICGFVPLLSFLVAMELVTLTNKCETDPRFFGSPSGSGSPATSGPTPSTVSSARRTRRSRATAGRR